MVFAVSLLGRSVVYGVQGGVADGQSTASMVECVAVVAEWNSRTVTMSPLLFRYK